MDLAFLRGKKSWKMRLNFVVLDVLEKKIYLTDSSYSEISLEGNTFFFPSFGLTLCMFG